MVERVRVSKEVEIAFERFGDSGEPILLIMGLGSQMLLWHERFCQRLADRGHQVVRYDNRDVGLSSRLEHRRAPSLRRLIAATLAGTGRVSPKAPYLIADMADDAAGLMDALGWERAHVVGTSLGGMVAQELALRHTERVISLTSIMSTPRPAIPSYKGLQVIVRRPKRGAEVEHFIWAFQAIGGPHMRDDTERLREVGTQVLARGASPHGFMRQLAAVVASGDRTARLRRLPTPTLVIHGARDPMVNIRMGRETAAAIPNSRLVEHHDMGHDMAEALWPRLIDDISGHVAACSP